MEQEEFVVQISDLSKRYKKSKVYANYKINPELFTEQYLN